MDHQTPDPDHGPSPSTGARIEGDIVRPLKRIAGSSRLRLPAALPFAIAGILVVSSVAFGATFVRNIVTPSASATPVIVGDEGPTDSPTLAPSQVPSVAPSEAPPAEPSEAASIAPSAGDLALTAVALPGKVTLTWTKYTGADFAYYKVVRSTDTTAAWPLGDGDTLVAAVDNVDDSSRPRLHAAPAPSRYRVFAVKSAGRRLRRARPSDVKTVTVTPAPTLPGPLRRPQQPGRSRRPVTPATTATARTPSAGTPTRARPTSATTSSTGQPYPQRPRLRRDNGHYWAYVGHQHARARPSRLSPAPGTSTSRRSTYPYGSGTVGSQDQQSSS